MTKLKPCPFCGGTEIRILCSERLIQKDGEIQRITVSHSTVYKCSCEKCGGGTGMMYSELAAREVWNRRADCGTA